MWKVTIDRHKCTDCGECMESCPGDVYEEVDGKIIAVNQEECHGCHTCEAVCPEDACSVEEK